MQPELRTTGSADVVATVRVRAAGERDLDAINRVVERAVDTWELPARVRRLALPSLRYTRDDLAQMDIVLATDACGAPCGVAAWETAAAAGSRPGASALLLHGLYVTPGAQRRGVGTRLLGAACDAAAARRVDGIELRAWRESRGFFCAHGFAPCDPDTAAGTYPRRLWRPLR